jgi:hypothetical protein
MTHEQDLLRRALVNLKALKANLPRGYIHEASFFTTFERSLDQLEQAGAEVSEWRLPHTDVGELEDSEFRVRIDAILEYFSVVERDASIRFRRT